MLKNGTLIRCTFRNVRCMSIVSEQKIIKSKLCDIVLPKLTLHEFIWENLDKWPLKTAVVCGITGRGYSYEQVFSLSNRFAATLRTKFNMMEGDCIAVLLPNSPDYPLVILGANEAGCVVTSINPAYTPAEIKRQIQHSDTKLIVTYTDKVNDVQIAINQLETRIPIIAINETNNSNPDGTISFNELVQDIYVDKTCLKSVRRTDDDIAFLPYSSGTTGLPKGVELTNKNLIANCLQITNEKIKYIQDTTENCQECLLGVLPFYHIFGKTVMLLQKMSLGCKIVTLPCFDVNTFVKAIEKHRPTGFLAVPPIIAALGMHPAVKRSHFKSIKYISSGAAPLSTVDAFKMFGKAQREIQLKQGYGLTETSPVVSLQTEDDNELNNVGILVPNTQVKIISENNEILGQDEVGEILVRGPQVMKGYRNTGDERNHPGDAFTEDGWFRTGDSGSYDSKQRLTISDRIKELIKVKGFQVAPAELEELMRSHPDVSDVAVIGVADKRTGEKPWAYIVPQGEKKPDASDIIKYVSENVAPFKQLAGVTFIEQIPKNRTGKILRKQLKEIHNRN